MRRLSVCLLLLGLFSEGISGSTGSGSNGEQDYIVYLGHLPSPDTSSEPDEAGLSAVEAAHHDLLNQVLHDGSYASDRIIRSYKRSLNGFAARLTEQQANKLADMEGIVSVFPSKTLQLLTTRSWDFLGFPQTSQEELPLQGDVIIGMVDGGIWLDSPSFSDEGFGPPPSRWKGVCQNFTCNKKVIGARSYRLGVTTGLSPLDEEGHGSHTASIAAGRAVGNVNFSGYAAGVARGAVPGARLAIYKVCWKDEGCHEIDILGAFDDAIADGVDVVSFSIGERFPSHYFRSTEAIGSFHGMRRGMVTSAGAGNSGLNAGRVCNVAPWMLSVGASSIDRRFIDRLILGNGKTIVGSSINTFPPVNNVTLAIPVNGSCLWDLEGDEYKGKILLCPLENTFAGNASGPFSVGAAGAVLAGLAPDAALIYPLPALVVSESQFDEIMAYANSTSNPVGTIERTVQTGNPLAPTSVSFSSPGPNMVTPDILKPDLSAPGVDIIASWSPLEPPSRDPNDKRKVLYNILPGTSMSCPHASGTAAYVKSFHRDWSTAMIMSALITTATPMNTPGNAGANDLKYGAGQLNPARARDPGLVYDASVDDYIAMLCTQGYSATQLALIIGSNTTVCVSNSTTDSARELNYPTMTAQVEPGKNFTVAFPRTVTNVGESTSATVYDVKVLFTHPANSFTVAIAPSRLEFNAQTSKASFTVTVSGVVPNAGQVISAAIVWSDNEHEVRSPVVVYTESEE